MHPVPVVRVIACTTPTLPPLATRPKTYREPDQHRMTAVGHIVEVLDAFEHRATSGSAAPMGLMTPPPRDRPFP